MKKKKSKIVGGKNDSTILRDPAYWRLRAEILAIIDFLGIATFESLSKGEDKPSLKEAQKFRKDFEVRIKKRAAFHLAEILEELENHSPELAAALDNRDMKDLDPD